MCTLRKGIHVVGKSSWKDHQVGKFYVGKSFRFPMPKNELNDFSNCPSQLDVSLRFQIETFNDVILTDA